MDINYLYKLIQYFMIYSFYGWILESVFKTIRDKKFINSGFLYGPFCPIYGIGAIIMITFLEQYKENIILVFLAGFLILSIWEYIVGFGLEKIFNTKYWDYSENRFNIHGRVCLFNSICWGLLGCVFVYLINPSMIRVLDKIPEGILNNTVLIFSVYIIIDFIMTIIKLRDIEFKLTKLEEITENIKAKVEQLKESNKENEELKKIIDELKEKELKIKRKLLVRINKMRRAFPSMNSKKLTKFLEEKIENMRNRR